jgi:putative transposase
MDETRQKRHNRKSLRLRHYDYSRGGAYFVTICTQDRKTYFEKFPDLQPIVLNQWNRIKTRFPEIELDEFVVMPNHIHGIIFIVGAIHESPLHELSLQYRRNMLLSKVVGYFKMNTAKEANEVLNRTGLPFWQRNYYEHVIRNEEELKKIQEYIQNNPLKWELDRENSESKNFNLDYDLYWREVYERQVKVK